ncbi:MAG TPA: transposase [Clostridiales bacterium]|nr:transposase [Clostridiales bacterium]
MNAHRFEMHFHTSEVSSCASVSASRSVPAYHDLGYEGIVVTDHYAPQFFEEIASLSWKQQVDRYLAGFILASEIGARLNLTILLGMEIRFAENNNDYLVYGLDRRFLTDNPCLYQMNIKTFHQLARKHHLLVFQAHPLRNSMTIVNPQWLDGYETFNANPRHDSRNDIASRWAQKFSLPAISGSDFHDPGDEGRSGLDFDNAIPDNPALVKALTNQAYSLVVPES